MKYYWWVTTLVLVFFCVNEARTQQNSVDKLIGELSSKDVNVRRQSANLLIELGPKAAKAIPALKDAMKDENGEVVEAAAEALAATGVQGIAVLAPIILEGSKQAKLAALRALGNLGPDAAPALDALIQGLKSNDFTVKVPAPDPDVPPFVRNRPRGTPFAFLMIAALKNMGPKAKAAIPALIEAGKETRDFDGSFTSPGPSNLADGVIQAVKAIDPEALPRLANAMIPGLLRVIEKNGFGPPGNALDCLRQLGVHGKPALPKLKELLPKLSERRIRETATVFCSVGEEGMGILAEFMLDPKTNAEKKALLLDRFSWEREMTPSGKRILLAALEDKTAAVRAAAARLLEWRQLSDSIPQLVKLMDDRAVAEAPSDYKGDDEFHVARALAKQGKGAVAPLMKALNHSSDLVRLQAAYALALIGKDAAVAIPVLEKMLQDSKAAVQIQAAKAILKTGKESSQAIRKIESQLQADSPGLGSTLKIFYDLGVAGRPLFPAVKRLALEARNHHIQRDSFRAIEYMQADPKEIVHIWVQLLQKNRWFLTFRPRALRTHGKEAAAAVLSLVKMLEIEDLNIPREAAETLAELGPAAAPAIPALIKAVDAELSLSVAAMDALAAIGGDAKKAIRPMVRRFDQITIKDREAAYHKRRTLEALAKFGPDAVAAVPRLIELLPEYPLAAKVLGHIGPGAKAATSSLEKIYQNERGYAKVWSAFALVKITRGTEPYVSQLTNTFKRDRDRHARDQALLALAALGRDARAALPTFLLALKEKGKREFGVVDVQWEAAKAIAHFGPEAKAGVPDLVDMVKNSYYAAQFAAAEALGAIGSDAREAIPALEQLARDWEENRAIVEAIIAKIQKK
jgi:HEAT repeat protein